MSETVSPQTRGCRGHHTFFFKALLQKQVIVPCPSSPVRTPLFPVKKICRPEEPVEWRFVQDLQAVNKAVVPRVPTVSNPHTIISQIPPKATRFLVVDLSNAFSLFQYILTLSIGSPSSLEAAPTCLLVCQGYTESPTTVFTMQHYGTPFLIFVCPQVVHCSITLMICWSAHHLQNHGRRTPWLSSDTSARRVIRPAARSYSLCNPQLHFWDMLSLTPPELFLIHAFRPYRMSLSQSQRNRFCLFWA